jgi:hypothetical protein
VLDDVAVAARTVRRAAERGYFDLRMGAVDSVASYLVPKMVAPLRDKFRNCNGSCALPVRLTCSTPWPTARST